jgi:phosphate:Na+ symporter
MTSTLHALDHASRLISAFSKLVASGPTSRAFHDPRAAALCKQAVAATHAIAESITSESALTRQAQPIGWAVSPAIGTALAELEQAAKDIDVVQRDQRAALLASVAPGQLNASEAFARIDAARRLNRLVHHAWRAAVHLLGQEGQGTATNPPGAIPAMLHDEDPD